MACCLINPQPPFEPMTNQEELVMTVHRSWNQENMARVREKDWQGEQSLEVVATAEGAVYYMYKKEMACSLYMPVNKGPSCRQMALLFWLSECVQRSQRKT